MTGLVSFPVGCVPLNIDELKQVLRVNMLDMHIHSCLQFIILIIPLHYKDKFSCWVNQYIRYVHYSGELSILIQTEYYYNLKIIMNIISNKLPDPNLHRTKVNPPHSKQNYNLSQWFLNLLTNQAKATYIATFRLGLLVLIGIGKMSSRQLWTYVTDWVNR